MQALVRSRSQRETERDGGECTSTCLSGQASCMLAGILGALTASVAPSLVSRGSGHATHAPSQPGRREITPQLINELPWSELGRRSPLRESTAQEDQDSGKHGTTQECVYCGAAGVIGTAVLVAPALGTCCTCWTPLACSSRCPGRTGYPCPRHRCGPVASISTISRPWPIQRCTSPDVQYAPQARPAWARRGRSP